ncbi:glycosyltransferase [Aquabacterium sp. G14]|uniref:glycosyltransferase n=1 Tax=Aquabacterium sp. G14 TaxID=3130164 RepID=UPI00309E952F
MPSSAPDTAASRRIVLTTFGTHGDVVPFIGLAKQLQALGHRPVLATSDFFRDLVTAHGVEYAPAAPHHSQHERDLGLTQAERLQKAFHPLLGGKFVMEKLVYPYMDQICAELDAACEGADLLVAPPTTPWAHMVAHKRGLPWKSVILQALTLSLHSAQDPPVVSNALSLRPWPRLLGEERYRRWFRTLRNSGRNFIKPLDDKAREYGMFDPARNPIFEGCISPWGSVAMMAPEMMRQPMPTDLPGPVDFAGFNFFDGNTAPLSDELEAFLQDGPPPLLFSLGSSLWFQAARFYPGWSKLCARLGVRAIFLAGQNALTGPLPAGQITVPWASVGALFPRCHAVVNTAGCGISSQVMHAGVPQLLVPFGMDQPDNAARLVRLGAALSVPPRKARGKTFEQALHRLIHDPTLHARARQLRQDINPVCGTVTAARLIAQSCPARHEQP